MHVGVIGAIVIGNPVDHCTRLLGTGAGIEEYEIRVVRKNRELASYSARIEPTGQPLLSRRDAPQTCRPHPYSSRLASRRATRESKCSRNGGGSTSSTTSRTK